MTGAKQGDCPLAVKGDALATIGREVPLDCDLNHWDEAAVHVALCCLISGVNQPAST